MERGALISSSWALISLTGNEQSMVMESMACELKLLCGVWEHCPDPYMFALRILLTVLN